MSIKMDGPAADASGSYGPLQWLEKVKSRLSSGGIVEFSPKGYSMWPTLRPGPDTVYVRASDEYRRSDIVLALCDSPHGIVLHRIKEVRQDRIILMGDSNLYQTETCSPGSIVGKVIMIRRGGRDISDSALTRFLAGVHRLPAGMRRMAVRILNLSKK